jgi:hypothetical protein
MNLMDLSPRWFEFGGNPRAGFIFRCPCCRDIWLSCKAIVLSTKQQMEIYHAMGLNEDVDGGCDVVPMRPETCWTIVGDFPTLRVRPSIHAGASGHWHGFIGEVTPGEIMNSEPARCAIKTPTP